MQQMITFLRKVLPTTGKYAAVLIGDYVKTTPCQTIEQLAQEAATGSARGFNSYFGLSSYAHTKTTVTATGIVKETIPRTQQNASHQKAFWLDLDVGESDKKYPTKEAALADLLRFLDTVGLPTPTVVCSGYGYHIYWCLEEQLNTETWLKVAAYIDAIAKFAGLRADTAVTMDPARILRVINTNNYKDGGCAPVTLLIDNPPVAPTTFVEYLLKYAQANNIQPTQKKLTVKVDAPVNPIIMQAMGGYVPGNIVPTKDAVAIVKGCRQIFDSGRLTYDTWFGMMDVIKYCHDGRNIVHTLSKVDPRYDHDFCEMKYNSAVERDNGPTLCSTFERHNPKGCEGCPHKGTINSPAQLGIIRTQPATHVQTVTVENTNRQYDIPAFKHPYFQMDESGMWELVEDNGVKVRKKICDYSFRLLYTQTRYISKHDKEIRVEVETMDALTKAKTYSKVDSEVLNSKDSFLRWCFNNRVFFDTDTAAKKATIIMKAYLAQLRASIQDIEVYDNIGWVTLANKGNQAKKGFVITETLYAEGEAPTQIDYSLSQEEYFSKKYQKQGSLEAWRKAIDFYRYKGAEPALFTIAAAFGSPFMEFMPDGTKAGMLNLWSLDSGVGKTTILRVANTVWGKSNNFTPKSSTINALYEAAALHRNLPVSVDEMTNFEGKVLSDFIYDISQGEGKYRLDSKLRMKGGAQWNLILFSTSNTSVIQRCQSFFMQREAEIKRVFEIKVNKNTFTSPVNTFEAGELWTENYGLAGPLLMERFIADKERFANIKNELAQLAAEFTKTPDMRYWGAVAAAAVLGARLARDYGIIDLDEDVIKQFAWDTIAQMRGDLIDNTTDATAHFGDFLFENTRSTLAVISHVRNKNTVPLPDNMDPYIKRMPTADLNIRIEEEEKRIIIRASALKEWINKKNGDFKHFMDELGRVGLHDWKAGSVQFKLASQVPSLPDVNARCFIFKLPDNLNTLISNYNKEEE